MDFPNLTQDQLARLRSRFDELDRDHNGSLTLEDFKSIHLDVAENPLTERTFQVLRNSGSHSQLTFDSLANSISQLSSTDENAKLVFVFQLYDVDNDGYISNEDLFNSVHVMCRNNLTISQLQDLVKQTIREFDSDGDGKISFDEFKNGLCGKIRLENQLNIEW